MTSERKYISFYRLIETVLNSNKSFEDISRFVTLIDHYPVTVYELLIYNHFEIYTFNIRYTYTWGFHSDKLWECQMIFKYPDTNDTPEYLQIQKNISKCEHIEHKQYYKEISINAKRLFSICLDCEPIYGDSINRFKAIKFQFSLKILRRKSFPRDYFSTIQQYGIWRLH